MNLSKSRGIKKKGRQIPKIILVTIKNKNKKDISNRRVKKGITSDKKKKDLICQRPITNLKF